MSVKLSVSWADLWWWMPGAALPMETSASCSADQQRRSQWNIKIIISGNEKNWSVWGGKLWLFKKNSWSSGIFSEQVRCLCLGKAMNCSIETDGSFKWTVHPKIKNVIFFFFFFFFLSPVLPFLHLNYYVVGCRVLEISAVKISCFSGTKWHFVVVVLKIPQNYIWKLNRNVSCRKPWPGSSKWCTDLVVWAVTAPVDLHVTVQMGSVDLLVDSLA